MAIPINNKKNKEEIKLFKTPTIKPGYNLRKEKEELLDQKLRDQEIIEEKTKKLENIASRLAKYLSPQVYKSIFENEIVYDK